MSFVPVDVTVGEDVDVMTVMFDIDPLIEIAILDEVSGASAVNVLGLPSQHLSAQS